MHYSIVLLAVLLAGCEVNSGPSDPARTEVAYEVKPSVENPAGFVFENMASDPRPDFILDMPEAYIVLNGETITARVALTGRAQLAGTGVCAQIDFSKEQIEATARTNKGDWVVDLVPTSGEILGFRKSSGELVIQRIHCLR